VPVRTNFLADLKDLMILAKREFRDKREKILERFTDGGLYPYIKYYLRSVKKRFNEYWKNHFSTIGLVGMNEACKNFLGKTIGDRGGKEFAIKVLDFMREVLIDFSKGNGK